MNSYRTLPAIMRDLRTRLNSNVEAFSIAVMGTQPSLKNREEMRWGTKHSLAISIHGSKRGLWYDHEAGIGGDLISLVQYIKHLNFLQTVDFCQQWLGDIARDGHAALKYFDHHPTQDKAKNVKVAKRIWAEGVFPFGTPAEVYLNQRGLEIPEACKTLKFHPACHRGRDRLPAMIGLMTDALTGEPVGIHRTFLSAGGTRKANGCSKMMLGQAGVIRLTENGNRHHVGIAEGIETALAISRAWKCGSIWAAGSAGGIARFPVVDGKTNLTVFPDADDNGASVSAANACSQRWVGAGRSVSIWIPPVGKDWADMISDF